MKKRGAVNYIWFFLLVSGVLYGIITKNPGTVTAAAIDYAKEAVKLCLNLTGTMCLWMGVMKTAEESGLVSKLSSLLRPVLKLLFPDVPGGHPAMGAIAMNISANMLGLGNAATPFGLKAVEGLNRLNGKKGGATDSMIMFLCINTASVTLIPSNVIAMRASFGSLSPEAVIVPSILSSFTAAAFGALLCSLLRKAAKKKKRP